MLSHIKSVLTIMSHFLMLLCPITYLLSMFLVSKICGSGLRSFRGKGSALPEGQRDGRGCRRHGKVFKVFGHIRADSRQMSVGGDIT